MPISAGHELNELDFLPTVSDDQPDAFTFNSTVYGIDVDSGTYVDCGVAFRAPNSGAVLILYSGRCANNTDGNVCLIAPVVRDGAVVGSGSTVLAASDDNSVRGQSANAGGASRGGSHVVVDGLAAGSQYNVRLEHRVGANIGTIAARRVTVMPVN
jgi:hypothetical protein